MGKRKYIRLRLSASEMDEIERLGLTITRATHEAIEYWDNLPVLAQELLKQQRLHYAIDNRLTEMTIGANRRVREWMKQIDNVSLTASAAIGIWLEKQKVDVK